jgi:hypothetical protein
MTAWLHITSLKPMTSRPAFRVKTYGRTCACSSAAVQRCKSQRPEWQTSSVSTALANRAEKRGEKIDPPGEAAERQEMGEEKARHRPERVTGRMGHAELGAPVINSPESSSVTFGASVAM